MNRHQGRHWLLGSNCGLWVSAPVSRVVTERIHVKDEGDLVGVLDTAEPEREDWGDTGPTPANLGCNSYRQCPLTTMHLACLC